MTTTNLSNVTGNWDFISTVISLNGIVNGALGLVILITIFLIVFISMKNTYESRRALMAASFFTTVISILLSVIGLVGYSIVGMLIILTGGIFLLLHGEEG